MMKKTVVEVSLKLVGSLYITLNLGLDLDKLRDLLSRVVPFIIKLPWYLFMTYCAYDEIIKILNIWGIMK